jgi:hypothetical protein
MCVSRQIFYEPDNKDLLWPPRVVALIYPSDISRMFRFELNRVAQQLFNEAKRERQESGKLTDGLLSALNCVFGQALLHALDLVDRGKLTEYQCLSGRRAFTVTGSGGVRSYICLPTSNFCTCPSYVYTVLIKGDAVMVSVGYCCF